MAAVSSDVEARIAELEADNKKLKADFKKLQRAFRRFAKENEDPDKPKKLSGFAKPMKLSVALTKFLGVSDDTMMARTDVTKEINKYVKAHGLQNPDNKKELILDAKLKTIIMPADGETVTFFNLQRFMSPHYIKESAEEAGAKKPEPVPDAEKKAPVKKIVRKVVKKT